MTMTESATRSNKVGESQTISAKLLLVDDEDNILRSLKRVLRKEPYELVTAASGDEALTLGRPAL